MGKNIVTTKNIAFAICFLDTLSFSVIIPLLPHLQEKMHISPSQLAFGVFLQGIISFLVTPILGKLADIFGKKNILLWSIIGNALGYILIMPYNYMLFLLSRIIGGASNANYGLAQGILSDLAKDENERKKLFSKLAISSGVGFIIGSLLASFLLGIYEYLPLILIIVLSLIMAIITIFIKDKKTSHIHHQISTKNFFHSRNFRYFLSIFIFVSISLQLWLTSLPIFLSNWYKVSSHHIGYILSILGLIFAFFQGLVFPYIIKNFSSKKILYFLIFCSIFFLLILQFSNISIVSLIILIGLTHNFIIMIQTIIQSQIFELYPNQSGKVGGILTSGSSLVSAISPLIGGYLVEYNGPLFFLCALFSLLALIAHFGHGRKIGK